MMAYGRHYNAVELKSMSYRETQTNPWETQVVFTTGCLLEATQLNREKTYLESYRK